MSLVRLLTSGKSLVGVKNPSHRFRDARGGWLPKFGKEHNPFAPGREVAATAPAAVSSPATAVPASSRIRSAAKVIGCGAKLIPEFKSAQPLPRVRATGVGAASTAAVRKLMSGARSASQWLLRVNPFSVQTRRPAGGARAATAVQAELSLEKVRVVRNDLSDADLEVVPLRSAAAKAAGASAGATSTDETLWSRLAETPVGTQQPQLQ